MIRSKKSRPAPFPEPGFFNFWPKNRRANSEIGHDFGHGIEFDSRVRNFKKTPFMSRQCPFLFPICRKLKKSDTRRTGHKTTLRRADQTQGWRLAWGCNQTLILLCLRRRFFCGRGRWDATERHDIDRLHQMLRG